MNTIAISQVTIRQTSDSLFNLNDLHKAAGKEKRHQPANWLALQQTSELITELKAPRITGAEQNQQVIQIKNGVGTFVCKELVYAYATWISPKFFLQVIRTFDAMTSNPVMLEHSLSTTESRKPLRDAVTLLHQQTGLHYQDCWRIVHQHIGKKAEEMNEEEVQAAINYIHLGLLNSNAFRRELPPPPKPQIVLNPIGYCRYLVASNNGEICHQSEIGNNIVVSTEAVRQLMKDIKTLSVAQAEMAKRMRILFGEYNAEEFAIPLNL